MRNLSLRKGRERGFSCRSFWLRNPSSHETLWWLTARQLTTRKIFISKRLSFFTQNPHSYRKQNRSRTTTVNTCTFRLPITPLVLRRVESLPPAPPPPAPAPNHRLAISWASSPARDLLITRIPGGRSGLLLRWGRLRSGRPMGGRRGRGRRGWPSPSGSPSGEFWFKLKEEETFTWANVSIRSAIPRISILMKGYMFLAYCNIFWWRDILYMHRSL